MTVGSPAKLIIQFMIPMCLGNLFQQFYNVVDSIVAGQFLGVQALAAIGSTGALMFFVIGWLNGLTSGFAIMVAQSFGAKQYDRMRHYVAMSIYLSIAFALVMTIGFSIANEPILRMMNYSDEIMPAVKGYMGIIYMGLLVTVAYDALSAFLRALGDSRSPLYFLMISAAINVILDIVFIVVIGMGVEGCAYATVIAQAVSAFLCFIYICKKFPILRLKKEDFRISLKSFGKLLGLGIPMALQFSITAIGTIIVQGAINIYGENCMAGFSAAGNAKYIYDSIRRIWSNHRHIRRTKPRSRQNGTCKTRCTLYTVHDLGVEHHRYDRHVFLRKIHDLSLHQSLRNRSYQCGSHILSYRTVVLPIPRKHFPV